MHLFLCFFVTNSVALDRAVRLAQDSGRVLLLSESPSDRLQPAGLVPPGAPPVLSFRYMEGSRRHGLGDLDLVVDDAGH
jgi:hypothetical protein